MDYWYIELWENRNGICLVERDLLKKMRRKEKYIYASLEEQMAQYVQTPIEQVRRHGELEKVKSEENMWELKFHLAMKNEVRFLGCLTLESGSSRFYSLYAFKKKDQAIKHRHRYAARGRIREFTSLYIQNGLQKIL